MSSQIENLRQKGVALLMAGDSSSAISCFDEALALSPEDELRDLLIINKASAQLTLRLVSAEIQELPQILMRRPKLRGLAAYTLAAKFENDKEFKRARFYLDLALSFAIEDHDERLRTVALVDLGNVCVYDSKLDDAISYYRTSLEIDGTSSESGLWRAFATGNLGYCTLMKGDPQRGAELIHEALSLFETNGGSAYTAEGLIDLCLAYLELGELDKAADYGNRGLERASEPRQIRNALYLLGEVAYKNGDTERATQHFDRLAEFYPDFPQLRNVLFALDLRKVVNFRL